MEIGKPWVRVFADFIGGAIVNARSFEEIQRLKAQLERECLFERADPGNKGILKPDRPERSLKRIVSQIDLVAPTEASVLILGETGTGKELVAYEIHNRSNRKKRADGPGELRIHPRIFLRAIFRSRQGSLYRSIEGPSGQVRNR